MSKILTLIAFVLSNSIYSSPPIKNSPIDAKTLETLRQNVCADVVSFAKYEGLKKYRMSHCLKNLEISFADETYTVIPNAPVKYKISFQDYYAKEIIKTEQWIMCEVEMTAPLNPDSCEFGYCSIEG